ncbi:hypothetical protein DUZ99_08330 [Xylanibacillus composti]|uniref:Uncharacterized protein n=1 Tax=Xylanibacillus composti TaxID=1572762 RepID=A0A8J4H5F4_9BACL|nr:hypothetical protein [Xylanibacillus composti]MDT9725000.1 hypothetical protein [Xylanibacillus composti]GIQ71293.1 hypothetical protein XYCOK13_41170 [Xylanibacillus composti]
MANIRIRPDLRTACGEICDIVVNGKYAGTLSLVYRERERLSGSIQLDRDSLPYRTKQKVVRHVNEYVQSLMDALQTPECDVIVTYSRYDHVIASEHNVGVIEGFNSEPDFDVDVDLDTRFDDVDPNEREMLEMEDADYMYEMEDDDDTEYYAMEEDEENLDALAREMNELEGWSLRDRRRDADREETEEDAALFYELVIVKERKHSLDYHIYDWNRKLAAEAEMTIYSSDVAGEVHWKHEPTEEEIEAVTDLIVSDFDDREIDAFVIDMKYRGDSIELIELTHEALLDEEQPVYLSPEDAGSRNGYREARNAQRHQESRHRDSGFGALRVEAEEFSAVLSRDDEDTLTYDIYQQSQGGLPIGTATIDISRRNVSGFIEFRDMGNEDDREKIASVLMREIDKEREFDTFSLTMLYQNEPFEEVLFENEAVH